MSSFSKYHNKYTDKNNNTVVRRESVDRLQDTPICCKKLKAELSQPVEVLQKSTQTCVHRLRCSGHKHDHHNLPNENQDHRSGYNPKYRFEKEPRHGRPLKPKSLEDPKLARALRLPSMSSDIDKIEPEGADGDCWLLGKESKLSSDCDLLHSLRTHTTLASTSRQQQKKPEETQDHRSGSNLTYRFEEPRHGRPLKPKSLEDPKLARALRLPSMTSDIDKIEPEGADADCWLLGKESKLSSDCDLLHSLRTHTTLASTSRQPQNKSSKLLESARAHCSRTKADFVAKYLTKESDSSKKMMTVITTTCGKELRTVVHSQIDMQARNELKVDTAFDLSIPGLPEEIDASVPETKKDQIPESASKHSPASTRPDGKSLSSSGILADLVSSKVIAPILRRVQRMYLNNIREEMKLMEDLEKIPGQVSDLCKTLDFDARLNTIQK